MIPQNLLLAAFLLFCRIGSCLMIIPGYSSPRLPMRLRLMVAMAITFGLTPLLLEDIVAKVAASSSFAVAGMILHELLIGGTVGVLGRIMFAALETFGVAAAMATGFGNVFGVRIDEGDSLPEIASLLTFFAVTLFFVTDQHIYVVFALAKSYTQVGVSDPFEARPTLVEVTNALETAFPIALRLTSPFMIYGIVANFTFGLINRLTPQIPVYFISMPFLIAGGLGLLYLTNANLISMFISALHAVLSR